MDASDRLQRWLLTGAGVGILVYCILILGLAATSPDLRMRFLLVEEPASGESPRGIRIQGTPGIQFKGHQPRPGDTLLRVGEVRIWTFLDFSRAIRELRDAPIPPGWGILDANADPSELEQAYSLPPLVKEKDGPRWVRVEYLPRDGEELRSSWIALQSLPLEELAVPFVWFLLELGIFAVGAIAFRSRPFDRHARLFFAMCIVTLGAFVGGYNWWLIAGHSLLVIPFTLCGILLPVVSLHFFLMYPRPKPPLDRKPRGTLIGLYAVPVTASACFLWLILTLGQLSPPGLSETQAAFVVERLGWLRLAIYAYVSIAAAYFAATLVAMVYSFFTTRNPIEHNQVKWILWASLIATGFIVYTLLLAFFDRVHFALGGGRIPMFIASLLFMLAYAVAIVRYKLMLVDQMVSRGMLYYVLTYGATALCASTIALSSLVPLYWGNSFNRGQALFVAGVVMISVALLIALRDVIQQGVDRRFFREKYRLDKALQRMNRAVGRLVDTHSLGDRMLGSCRDVLQADRAALYLRDGADDSFRLIATTGGDDLPLAFSPASEFIQALQSDASLQRITPGVRNELTPVQSVLRELRAELVHALEVDGDVAGLVVLGAKRNGALYTAEDVTFLTALGQITGIALHSAKIHQDLTRVNEEMRLKVERISQQSRQIRVLQTELANLQAVNPKPQPDGFRRDAIKGSSPSLLRVLETVRKVAVSDSSVLLRGESGTGKELLAQSIHDNSPRRGGPMIRVHCASLSPGLLESELFGHVKGAFTGAHSDRMGRFALAHGGTLFLDEIGDISLETQIKLLRVLQERTFEPVGGTETIHVDVRLIAATHQNLEAFISAGRFREDLYYRLNVISVTLPPLRQRQEDIFELALYFLTRSAARDGKRITQIDDAAMDALIRYPWPGNIRELENVIERAVVMADGEEILLGDLPAEIVRTVGVLPHRVLETKPVPRLGQESGGMGGITVEGLSPAEERQLLTDALERADGNKAQAARLLGMARSTYYSKLKKYSIE